jgi:hypothetical protein
MQNDKEKADHLADPQRRWDVSKMTEEEFRLVVVQTYAMVQEVLKVLNTMRGNHNESKSV